MKKYRKKPVVIEAVKFNYTNKEIMDEMLSGIPEGVCSFQYATTEKDSEATEYLFIHTLEGLMCVNDGDYIIKGVQGEYYPCKPDIFKMTYDPVEENEPYDLANTTRVICPLCGTEQWIHLKEGDNKVRCGILDRLPCGCGKGFIVTKTKNNISYRPVR